MVMRRVPDALLQQMAGMHTWNREGAGVPIVVAVVGDVGKVSGEGRERGESVGEIRHGRFCLVS